MAEVKIKNPVETPNTESFNDRVEDVYQAPQTASNLKQESPETAVRSKGLSQEELNDPNKIRVEIADRNAPVVVLFGPPSCGKTMTLVRLTRFLRKKGYTVEPVREFRPSYDTFYKSLCDDFNDMIASEDAAQSTSRINFMLAKVRLNGRTICQILEGPGEYCFNPSEPQAKFPKYFNAIIGSPNRKIWLTFVEPGHTNVRMDVEERRAYVEKIKGLKVRIRPSDRIVFVFNKIDETSFVLSPGRISEELARQEVDFQYPGIFKPFKNEVPILNLWNPYLCDFVPFQSGDYCMAADGTLTFQESSNEYPMKLWNLIMRKIRG